MYQHNVQPEPRQLQQLLPSSGDAPTHHYTLTKTEGRPLSVAASWGLDLLLAGLV